MFDPVLLLAATGLLFGAIALTSLFVLRGWRGWLELKRLELSGPAGNAGSPPAPVCCYWRCSRRSC